MVRVKDSDDQLIYSDQPAIRVTGFTTNIRFEMRAQINAHANDGSDDNMDSKNDFW